MDVQFENYKHVCLEAALYLPISLLSHANAKFAQSVIWRLSESMVSIFSGQIQISFSICYILNQRTRDNLKSSADTTARPVIHHISKL